MAEENIEIVSHYLNLLPRTPQKNNLNEKSKDDGSLQKKTSHVRYIFENISERNSEKDKEES